MARIRTIKPSFFVNEQLAALAYGDRLLFIGLWTQADKAGRLEDRPMRLKAALFPYDDFNVIEALGRLTNAGLITKYEGNGRKLIAIPTWEKHQRPHKSEQESELPAVIPKDGEIPEGQRLEKGKEYGEGKGTDSAVAARTLFDLFWECYPKKVGKEAAWSVWQRLRPDRDLLQSMLDAIGQQARTPQWAKDDGQFIPHPKTWLHQGRWQDSTSVPMPKTAPALTRLASLGMHRENR